MDYVSLMEFILEFDACDLRKCVDVIIRDDLIPEGPESFFVVLGGAPDRITLEPTEAEIEIIDANSKFEVKID